MIRKLADGRLQGDMLDGVGFQLAAEAQGFQPAGKQALLSGCGGVGSAIAGTVRGGDPSAGPARSNPGHPAAPA